MTKTKDNKSIEKAKSTLAQSPRNNDKIAKRSTTSSILHSPMSSRRSILAGTNEKLTQKMSEPEPQTTATASKYALVFFLQDKKYSIILLSQVVKGKDDDYELEAVYQCVFNNKLYQASLLVIGSKENCDNHLKSFQFKETQASKNSKNQKKSNNQANRANSDMTSEANPENINEEDENDNSYRSNRQEEINQINMKQSEEISQLKNENQQLKQRYNEFRNAIDEEKRAQMVETAKSIISNLGTPNDLNDLVLNDDELSSEERVIVISPIYPSLTMPYRLKLIIDDDHQAHRSDTCLFRTLIRGLCTDEGFWLNNNADAVFASHEKLLFACLDLIKTYYKRTEFTIAKVRKSLRELHAEARRLALIDLNIK